VTCFLGAGEEEQAPRMKQQKVALAPPGFLDQVAPEGSRPRIARPLPAPRFGTLAGAAGGGTRLLPRDSRGFAPPPVLVHPRRAQIHPRYPPALPCKPDLPGFYQSQHLLPRHTVRQARWEISQSLARSSTAPQLPRRSHLAAQEPNQVLPGGLEAKAVQEANQVPPGGLEAKAVQEANQVPPGGLGMLAALVLSRFAPAPSLPPQNLEALRQSLRLAPTPHSRLGSTYRAALSLRMLPLLAAAPVPVSGASLLSSRAADWARRKGPAGIPLAPNGCRQLHDLQSRSELGLEYVPLPNGLWRDAENPPQSRLAHALACCQVGFLITRRSNGDQLSVQVKIQVNCRSARPGLPGSPSKKDRLVGLAVAAKFAGRTFKDLHKSTLPNWKTDSVC
jgi:hypothetical protein